MARSQWQNPSVLERIGSRGPEWYIRYRENVLEMQDGKPVMARPQRWAALGLVSEMTKRQAERKKDEIMRRVNGSAYTIQSQVPFREFLKVYREQHYRGLKQTSRDYYEGRISKWIEPAWSDLKLCQIGPLEVSALLGKMESEGVARSTRVSTRAIIGKMFKRARQWGFIQGENPARDAEVGRTPGNARTIWTPTLGEAQAIIAAAGEPVATMLELIVWTGMRISEVCGLRCGDIGDGLVYVRRGNVRGVIDSPKSDAGKRQLGLGYLAERMAPMLKDSTAFVFLQETGEPWTDKALQHKVRDAMVAANLYHVGNAWHAFRRLHLTVMSQHMTLFDLRQQAGHVDLATTQRYVAGDSSRRAATVRGVQDKIVPIRKGA